MSYWYHFSFLLLVLFRCQSIPVEAPLVGHWQFQQMDQFVCLPNGTIVEKIIQRPPHSSERGLDITATELVYHHVMDKSYSGDSLYTVTRPYTRQDSTLWVVPYPGIEAGPVRIRRLTDHQLALWSELRQPGGPYTLVRQYFTR